MKKKILLVSSIAICIGLPLALFFHYIYRVLTATEMWSIPPIAKETINGVHNPLRIKEFVYRYGAYDKELMEADYSYGECSVDLYTLIEPLPQGDIKLYLRQFDRESLKSKRKSNKNILLVVEDQSIYTTWMQLHEFKPSIFNPFDHNLKRQEELGQIINLENQEKYSFFLRCLEFIKDTTEPYKKKALVKRSGWDFYEEFKNKETQEKYNQLTVVSALNDPNTLISMMDSCSRSHVYYYNASRNIFFELTFNFGRIKNNPNRACR